MMTTGFPSLEGSTQNLLGNAPSVNVTSSGDPLTAAEIFAVVLMSVTTLVAFQANFWIVVVVLIHPQLRSTLSNIFVVNLCCVDLLASGVSLPMSIVTFVEGADGLDETTCDVNGFFSTCVMVTSVLSLCAISIERYYTIAFPMHQAGHATPSLYFLVVALVWGASLMVASLPLLGVNSYRFRPSRRSCSYNWQGGGLAGTAFILLVFFISFLIPSIILLSMYAGIFRVAKKAATVVTPNAHGISLSPMRSHVTSTNREEANKHPTSSHFFKVTPRINVMEVSHDSAPNGTGTLSRRLSAEDSGIRTADFTDTMSANSFFVENNNDRHNEMNFFQCANVHCGQDSNTLAIHVVSDNLFSCQPSDASQRKDVPSSTSAHPVSDVFRMTGNDEQLLHSVSTPAVVPYGNRIKSSHMKAFKTLMIIVVSYLVQWGPYFICILHELGRGQEVSEPLEQVVNWLSYSSYAVNPVLYGCMNRQIREELVHLLSSIWRSCCCCCYLSCNRCYGKPNGRRSCIATLSHKQTARGGNREMDQPRQGEDLMAGEAESFYQFLQRTQASEESSASRGER
ncbi:hypothetical protein Btru_033597 [Bulinus truncatus]|nr:hypothetical protein Btru_033597 [Bulinus truncatus]